MNPFTRSLLADIDDPPLAQWVSAWDQIEALLIDCYRAGEAEAEAAAEYAEARRHLLASVDEWLGRFEPHWRGRLAGGEPLEQDPFRSLLAREQLSQFVGDWSALQLLPAAREAINDYLIDRLEQTDV